MNKSRKVAIAVCFLGFVLLIAYLGIAPSNERNWSLDQKLLPYAEVEGQEIKIYNVRNFTYFTISDFEEKYYNKTFNLKELDTLWYVVEPFSDVKGAAHTFFSFGFGDEFVSISVEIRKKEGDSFSALRGLFRQYELMYVIADEQDVIKLRANHRKDEVYLYQIHAEERTIQALFVDMLERTNKLHEEPEFYNTITNTCTTNIVKHVNDVTPARIPFSLKVLLPAYSDKLVYDMGLVDTDLPFKELREEAQINDLSETYKNDPQFSLRIRGR